MELIVRARAPAYSCRPSNAALYATSTQSTKPIAFGATAYYKQNIGAHSLRTPPIPAGAKTGRGDRARRDKRRATATQTRGRRRQRTPGLNGAAVAHTHLELMVAPPCIARTLCRFFSGALGVNDSLNGSCERLTGMWSFVEIAWPISPHSRERQSTRLGRYGRAGVRSQRAAIIPGAFHLSL
jgi:hypothetical protein